MTNDNMEASNFIYKTKYLQAGESFEEGMTRIAGALQDSDHHFREFRDVLLDKRFLPAGRVQVSVGSIRETTPYNCYVSGTIEDSMDGITKRLAESLQTMRLGGGIGYDFSTLRPSGDIIRSLDSHSCGPVGDNNRNRGFMDLFDAGCSVISSAGHRRGAQMGVLRVDHPDIFHFIRAKRTPGRLTNFNVSVGITDEFMAAVENDESFGLRFEGRVYSTVRARNLWDEIMRSTWDWAEPGVLFLDTINRKNNLWYCEKIAATNPCGEQPLPPYGACLLGSFNLTKYIDRHNFNWDKFKTDTPNVVLTADNVIDRDYPLSDEEILDLLKRGDTGLDTLSTISFNWEKFKHDIPAVVRAMDNVIDRAIYPLPEQEREAKSKRRMGLGITGLANTAEILGYPYGSEGMLKFTKEVLTTLRDTAYLSSVELAIEKGPFELWDNFKYFGNNSFVSTLPIDIRMEISKHGIRNSHLLSIAPTGSISLAAGNISSGIEPPYTSGEYRRNVYDSDGSVRSFNLMDYAEANYGVVGKTSDEVTLDEHVDVLSLCSSLVDSSVSKTCNVGPDVSFLDFKDVYMKAYKGGASGITTFRPAEYGGKREGIMSKKETAPAEEGAACWIDEQGNRTCD